MTIERINFIDEDLGVFVVTYKIKELFDIRTKEVSFTKEMEDYNFKSRIDTIFEAKKAYFNNEKHNFWY